MRIPKRNERTGKDLWEFTDTVWLPDDIEILVDNAHLRLAEGTYINMFANEKVNIPGKRTLADEQKNITLRGIGNAVLDGGIYNGLWEGNSEQNGLPRISENTLLFFANVSGVTVENLRIINRRWWSITNICVRRAVFRNINFRADISRITSDGTHYPDQFSRTYAAVRIGEFRALQKPVF